MNKHKPIDRRRISRPLTNKEKEFNTWYVDNMFRLGLACNLDINTDDIEYCPFNSVIEYEKAKLKAIQLLSHGEQVPKDLEEKLLIVANKNI